MRLPKFSRRQWLTIITIGVADFCNAICVSLQAPFYPKEAEAKGCSATEYGLVFGIFELVVFFVAPIYGKYMKVVGPKFMFTVGTMTVGICAILFGLLDKVSSHIPFISLSLTIRVVEALGNAGFLTASFAIIAKEFPDNVATTFASLETFFGLGLIAGPTVGGALYEAGGYSLPFAIMGTLLVLAAMLTLRLLPKTTEERDINDPTKLMRILRIPSVMVSGFSIIVTSMSIGFLQATLEPHLRSYNLPPTLLGVLFVVNGGVYAFSAPIFGTVCDKKVDSRYVTLFGCTAIAIGFSFIGPAPFLPIDTNIPLTIVGLVLHGMGIGSQLVAGFMGAMSTCVRSGLSNNVETYGMVSGLWSSAFALGAFIGPTVAGVLYDAVGFRSASMFVAGLNILVGLLVAVLLLTTRKKEQYKILEEQTSLQDSNSRSSPPSQNGSARSHPATPVPMQTPIPIAAPPGMNGIIARNSYKNRHGTWHMSDSESVPRSSNFGSPETRSLLSTHGV